MKEIDEFLKYSNLFATYKPLFSGKQRIYLEAFLEEDNSFAEIADAMNVSRQAVFDNIKRACKKLEYYEKQLGILKKDRLFLEKLVKLRKDFTVENLDKLIEEVDGS